MEVFAAREEIICKTQANGRPEGSTGGKPLVQRIDLPTVHSQHYRYGAQPRKRGLPIVCGGVPSVD